MKIQNFNKQYKEEGGIVKLNEFRSMSASLETMAIHFQVSRERIRQWFKEFYKEQYDPRPERRKRIIESMIEFASKNTEEDFKEAFGTYNTEYYAIALSTCYDKGIYRIEDTNQLKLNI